MIKWKVAALLVFKLSTPLVFAAATETNRVSKSTPTPYLSPAAEARTFMLPKGYHLELVLSEPVIREPVVTAFDGDGRMFVAEMRTYMQDIDGTNEHTNRGRISLHWSSKHDGNFNRHSVFADKLLLPRMILPVADGLLVNETDSNDIWLYQDMNGDGVSDKKTRIFDGGKRGGNLEHQQSGLLWNLDNWLYMAVNDYRLRLNGTNVLKETIPSAGGQWGLARDDYGKPWFINAGGEIGPLNFQQPIIYGRFSFSDEIAEGYRDVWPLVGLADVQGGEIRFRPEDKTLNHLTAACGDEIFRGDRLPEDLRGDLLFAEPVGRLIRRTKIEVKDGVTHLRNPYVRSEFICSTDPNFRPVNMVTAPDGTLYIVDMYRGIIQEGNWVKTNSYLRRVVQQHRLEKNFGRGRIWRLVHDDFTPGPQPRLQKAESAQLVETLAHPNGWWRDTAQKLLVLRQDKSVVPMLNEMARQNKNHLARIHALWTLEGLDALTTQLLREKFADAHPQVRVAAIRASETLYKKGETSLEADIRGLATDPDPNVVIQTIMTANLLKWKDANPFIEKTMKHQSSTGVQQIGAQLLTPSSLEGREFNSAEKKLFSRGESIYNELCFSCHGTDAKGMPLQGEKTNATMAPPLAGSKTVTGLSDGIIEVLLKGLSGAVEGKTYEAQMVSMESNNDEWISAVASYVRNSFGNNASLIRTNDVARLRALFKERQKPWTIDEIQCVVPRFLTNRPNWKVTASHVADRAERAIDGKIETRYESGIEQTNGMWFQIELPEETTVSGLYLDAATSPKDYPRRLKVEVSGNGKDWKECVAKARGNARTTEILFDPLQTKFIRMTQTGSSRKFYWSIHELQILQPPDPAKIKAAQTGKAAPSQFE